MIGRVFKELRYIEQWGSGILNAIGECKTMGLPEPVFEELAFRFRATISLVAEQEPELEVTQKIRQLCRLRAKTRDCLRNRLPRKWDYRLAQFGRE